MMTDYCWLLEDDRWKKYKKFLNKYVNDECKTAKS